MTGGSALIVVTHLLGVGHLARAAAIGRALAATGWRVVVASGGAPSALINLDGCECVQLPPLRCEGADFRTLLTPEGAIADDAYLDARRVALLALFDDLSPDVLITELYPFGRRQLAAEFDALLARAAGAAQRPAILASVRDVLQPPSKPEKAASAEKKLACFYDAILVHGEDDIVPLSASWPVSQALQRRLRATGYVHDSTRADAAGDEGTDEIIVSGGGSAAGLALAQAALAAAKNFGAKRWRLLIGHGVDQTRFDSLREQAGENVIVERARPDFPVLLQRAALSISQAGYNTIADLAAANARAILVPFAANGEREQTIRAGKLAARGLADVVAEHELSADALTAAVRRKLAEPRPDWSALPLNGAARAADMIASEAAKAAARRDEWLRLRATLDALRRSGKRVPVWLRDDDVIEMTGALVEFLDIAKRWGAPATLAAIPSRLSSTLEADLAPYPETRLLAHGLSHDNHADPDAKASEFPQSRPLDSRMEDARRGLAELQNRAPALALPIFTPPWNRAAPDLIERLSELGYRGLSASASRRAPATAKGLPRRDAHWDPIAWRKDRGLRAEDELLSKLNYFLAQDLAADAPLEPLGLLTHHLVHDGWINRFLNDVLGELAQSDVITFLRGDQVFGSSDHAAR